MATLIAIGGLSLPISAQQPVHSDGDEDHRSIDVTEERVEVVDEGPEDDDGDDNEESAGDSPFQSFDDVTVERVRPDEVPDFKPGLPGGPTSQLDTSELPQAFSGQQMREVTNEVASSTVEILAVETPPQPYQATKMVYRGHALWVSPHRSGEEPVLLSTADWLTDADAIYAVDAAASSALSDGGLAIGDHQSRSIDDVMADAGDFIERYRDHLVALDVDESNVHVNLALLTGADGKRLATPDRGLVLHEMDQVVPGAIFGYSPATGQTITPVGYQNSADLAHELSFYFLVDYQATLGAPIVGTDGQLIGMTALRHPSEPEHTLAIPPGPIHAFLGTGRADGDDDDS